MAGEDEVFVWGHYRWTMRTSGVSKHSEWLHELTVRDEDRVVARPNDTAILAAAYHAAPAAARQTTTCACARWSGPLTPGQRPVCA